jgi:hypothetical protein
MFGFDACNVRLRYTVKTIQTKVLYDLSDRNSFQQSANKNNLLYLWKSNSFSTSWK